MVEFEHLWQADNAARLDVYQFEKDLELPHDLITPNRPDAHIERVYPRLLEWIR